MSIFQRLLRLPAFQIRVRRSMVATLIISSSATVGLLGCGQKGDLYLVETDSQTVIESSDALNSTRNPQDAAFAGIDDDDYQRERYLEQKRVMPEASTDPNDY